MSLFDIKKKLYQKNQDQDLSQHEPSQFDVRTGGAQPSEKFKAKEEWETDEPVIGREQHHAIKWGALVIAGILGLVLLVVGVLQFSQASFSEKRVTVAVDGPKYGESGKLLVYTISYKNENRVALKNATLHISYPDSFTALDDPNFQKSGNTGGIVNIGEIKSGVTGQFFLKGRAYNPKGTLIYVKADLSYTPANFNSQFDSLAQADINVTSTPVELEIMAPQSVSSGDAVDYQVNYKNTGQKDFENILIKIDYPDGFTYGKAEPLPSEGNNTWYIGHLAAGQEGKIVVSGRLDGSQGDIKNVVAHLGLMDRGQFFAYNEEKSTTSIGASPLSISQTVNGLGSLNVDAGEALRFEINYANKSNLGYRDVIITERLDSPVLDYASLHLDGGAFDMKNKLITWKASDFPELRALNPGQNGTIRFSINVKDVIPVANANDKNFIISSLAKIDSPDIPTPIRSNKVVAGNEMDMRLNSKIVLGVKGFYNDTVIPNSGPIPPQVGQETTYTIHWQALNVSNDVTGARAEAVLPTGIAMTDKTFPDNPHLTFNDRTNTLTWELGNLSAGTGIITAPQEAVFQIKLTPSPDQANASAVDLLGPVTFTAKDTFTGTDLKVTTEKKTTILQEDTQLNSNAYHILPAN